MISEHELIVEFDGNVYDVEAIKKAAYVFIDRFSANISVQDTKILCAIRFPESTAQEIKKSLVDDFHKEALDQDLRHRITAETANYRNAILALAFSSTKFTQSE
jgi:His-Xaa-Ser system protein HxsD